MAFKAMAIVSAVSLAVLCCVVTQVFRSNRVVTHFKLVVPLLQKSSIHIMNTVRKRIEYRTQRRMK